MAQVHLWQIAVFCGLAWISGALFSGSWVWGQEVHRATQPRSVSYGDGRTSLRWRRLWRRTRGVAAAVIKSTLLFAVVLGLVEAAILLFDYRR